MSEYEVGQKYNGFTYLGEYSDPRVNNGDPLPEFEMSDETAESWKALARKLFLRNYFQEHGHEPADFESELAEYNRQIYLAIGRPDLANLIKQ